MTPVSSPTPDEQRPVVSAEVWEVAWDAFCDGKPWKPHANEGDAVDALEAALEVAAASWTVRDAAALVVVREQLTRLERAVENAVDELQGLPECWYGGYVTVRRDSVHALLRAVLAGSESPTGGDDVPRCPDCGMEVGERHFAGCEAAE